MNNSRRQFLAGMAATGVALAAGQDIFEAAASGNLERAKQLCTLAPAIVHLKNDEGRTPLHVAAAAGQSEMVGYLAFIGAADLTGAPEGLMAIVADLPDRITALEMATTLGNNGSDPNARNKDGIAAVELAVRRGNREVAQMLVHRGAPAFPGAEKIEQVYFGARYRRDLKGNSPVRDDTNGLPQEFINQFVILAHNDAAKVKAMLKTSPALLATRATWDESAIEGAAHMGLEPLARDLAEAGSPVSTCTAVMLGLSDTVKTMVREDKNCLRERGAHDFPLLYYTMFAKERPDLAAFLLDAGATANPFGFSSKPLHIAATKGHLEIAQLLLDHGADLNATAISRKGPGPTPLAAAQKAKQTKMVDLLTSRGARAS